MPWPSGSTLLAGVIGDPVRHSRSPAIHNAAFAHTGLDWAFVAFPVSAEHARAAILGARALAVRGLAVTMPHKQLAAGLADRRSREVERLGSANTLSFEDGSVRAESTDGAGFLADLRRGLGFEPAGQRCVVIGGGGAAAAVALSLAGAGAADIAVLNRSGERAAGVAGLAGAAGRIGGLEDLGQASLVVNATPVGMAGGASSWSLPDSDGSLEAVAARLHEGQLCYDLVYHPLETALVSAARRRGARASGGLGMLVEQAALQFEIWTGLEPPRDVMREAAMAAGGGDRPAAGTGGGPLGS